MTTERPTGGGPDGATDDHREIEALYARYARALDTRRLELLDECFSPGARLEYRTLGAVFTRDEFKAVGGANLARLDATHHVMSNFSVEVDDRTASARVYYTAQHVREALAPDHLYLVGGWYDDTLTRDSGGWRITERVAEPVWWQGNPAVLGLPTPRPSTTPEGADARRSLRELVERYAWAADARDADAFADLWAPDSRLSIHQGPGAPVGSRQGREELRGVVEALTRFEQTLHLVANHRVSVLGDEAEGEVSCVAHHILPPEGERPRSDLMMFIRYVDRYRRSEEHGWRFADRECRIQWTRTAPVDEWFADLPPASSGRGLS